MSTAESERGVSDKITTDEKISQNTNEQTPVFDPAPDGGLKAWLVAAGGACIFFSALGFSNSFGVFEQYYLAHQLKSESPDKVAWIGSLQACLQFLAGVLGGPLFDRYGSIVSLYDV